MWKKINTIKSLRCSILYFPKFAPLLCICGWTVVEPASASKVLVFAYLTLTLCSKNCKATRQSSKKNKGTPPCILMKMRKRFIFFISWLPLWNSQRKWDHFQLMSLAITPHGCVYPTSAPFSSVCRCKWTFGAGHWETDKPDLKSNGQGRRPAGSHTDMTHRAMPVVAEWACPQGLFKWSSARHGQLQGNVIRGGCRLGSVKSTFSAESKIPTFFLSTFQIIFRSETLLFNMRAKVNFTS